MYSIEGGGGFEKRWSFLISLFSKNDDELGRGVKISKNWWRLLWMAPYISELYCVVRPFCHYWCFPCHVGVSKFSGLVTMMPNLETQKQNEVKSIAQRRKITRKLGRKNTSSLSFFGFCLHNIEVLLQALKWISIS